MPWTYDIGAPLPKRPVPPHNTVVLKITYQHGWDDDDVEETYVLGPEVSSQVRNQTIEAFKTIIDRVESEGEITWMDARDKIFTIFEAEEDAQKFYENVMCADMTGSDNPAMIIDIEGTIWLNDQEHELKLIRVMPDYTSETISL